MLAKVSQTYRPLVEANDDVQLGTDLITDINGHATQFPIGTFGATMTAFAPIQTTYTGMVNAAKGGDAAAVSARNVYRAGTWLPQVDKIANLVNIQSAGDPSIILLSGFHATKITRDASVIPVQMNLNVTSTAANKLNYESKTIVSSHIFTLIGRIAADVTLTQDGDKIILDCNKATQITLVNTNNKKGALSGLPSGAKMAWIIVARNPAGTGDASQDANVTIQ
jgi:hypothetical protein